MISAGLNSPVFSWLHRIGLTGLVAATALVMTGCAGYQLGTSSTPKFSTLFVAPIRSEALIPQAQVLVTTQIRDAVIRDGRVKLVDSPADADAVLHVSLIGYDRAVAVSRADDTGLARRFDVSLRAHLTLTDNRSNKDYFHDRLVVAKRGVFTDSGSIPSEYHGMPLLAEQLAKDTLSAVLDTW
jgi:hypothetical protein